MNPGLACIDFATDVHGCSQWNGVLIQEEVCTQRPGGKELHVSSTTIYNYV